MLTSAYRIAEHTDGQVVVTVPGSSLLSGWLVGVLVAVFLFATYFSTRSIRRFYADEKSAAEIARIVKRNYVFAVTIPIAFCLFFWAVSYTSGSIRLDRAANVASMESKSTVFLPARTRTVPLSTVREAILDAKPNSRRIRLLVEHGTDLAYPAWSDREGQDAAVTAINELLDTTRAGRQR